MTKIAIDARESGTSTGRYIDKLIEYMYRLKPEFEIIVLTKPHRIAYFKEIAPNFTVTETSYKEFSFGEQLGFKKRLEQLKPDLIHFAMVQQPVLYRGKTVTTMHDLTTTRFRNPTKNWIIFTLKQQVYKLVNWYIPHKSQRVLVPSVFVKEDVVRYAHINPQKVMVTYESADPISEKPVPIKSLVNQEFLLCVGRPLPHKNLPRLIDAFVDLKKLHPNLRLVLAGKNDTLYQSIKDDIKKREIKDVIFPGFVSEGQLRWLYEHCKVYVFPSLSEGFGLPGLEAMQHGAPVASSEATCLPEIYGKAAAYFNPLDVYSMIKVIDILLTNKAEREQLIQAGKERITHYSWQQMAEQTLEVYKESLV